MSDDTFGQTLRQERERRGISLERVANQTKISASLFLDLERGNVSRWPTGIFRRAFIRSYAEAIGLNPDRTLADFQRAFPEEGQRIGAGPYQGSPPRKMAETFDYSTLRLTLAEPPDSSRATVPIERRRRPRSRPLMPAGIDAAIVVVPSVLAAVVFGTTTFWIGLAAAVVASHLAVSFMLGCSPGMWLMRLQRAASSRESGSARTIPFPQPSGEYRVVSHSRSLEPLGLRRDHRRHA